MTLGANGQPPPAVIFQDFDHKRPNYRLGVLIHLPTSGSSCRRRHHAFRKLTDHGGEQHEHKTPRRLGVANCQGWSNLFLGLKTRALNLYSFISRYSPLLPYVRASLCMIQADDKS